MQQHHHVLPAARKGVGGVKGGGGLLQWNLTVNRTVELTRVFNCPVVVFWFVACVF